MTQTAQCSRATFFKHVFYSVLFHSILFHFSFTNLLKYFLSSGPIWLPVGSTAHSKSLSAFSAKTLQEERKKKSHRQSKGAIAGKASHSTHFVSPECVCHFCEMPFSGMMNQCVFMSCSLPLPYSSTISTPLSLSLSLSPLLSSPPSLSLSLSSCPNPSLPPSLHSCYPGQPVSGVPVPIRLCLASR